MKLPIETHSVNLDSASKMFISHKQVRTDLRYIDGFFCLGLGKELELSLRPLSSDQVRLKGAHKSADMFYLGPWSRVSFQGLSILASQVQWCGFSGRWLSDDGPECLACSQSQVLGILFIPRESPVGPVGVITLIEVLRTDDAEAVGALEPKSFFNADGDCCMPTG